MDGVALHKSSSVFALLGGLDELQAHLGVVVVHLSKTKGIQKSNSVAQALQLRLIKDALIQVQHQIYLISASIAGANFDPSQIEGDIQRFEEIIDACEAKLPPLRHFIRYGSEPISAQLYLARAVCRRVEREYWQVAKTKQTLKPPPRIFGQYLNRLSDLLFIFARTANQAQGKPEERL